MISPHAEQAAEEAIEHGYALMKFISPNDVGQTGGHQCGYYLPKAAWEHFTVNPPEKGKNSEEWVEIDWQDNRTTHSRITWYGTGTRSEYRLTRFGRHFPFLSHDSVGNLLVLIRVDDKRFHGFVLDLEDDIEELQSRLGVEIQGMWGFYSSDQKIADQFAEESCINRQFRNFCEALLAFPPGEAFTEHTLAALQACVTGFTTLDPDTRLMRSVAAEYELFRMAERKLCSAELVNLKGSIDDFLEVALRILNRRKSRAGRALENHVHRLLNDANIPHDMRPPKGVGRIDVIIPSTVAYLDSAFPAEQLIAIGIKTTCKDRWAQVLKEAQRVPHKHILTLQKGIATSQLREMKEAGVVLIVPEALQKLYPTKDSGMQILTIAEFLHNAPKRN